MSQGESHWTRRFVRSSRVYIAVGATVVAVASGVTVSTSDGPPLTEQANFWLSLGSAVLGFLVAAISTIAGYQAARRQEQLTVAASQERLARAEGDLVHALHRQAARLCLTTPSWQIWHASVHRVRTTQLLTPSLLAVILAR